MNITNVCVDQTTGWDRLVTWSKQMRKYDRWDKKKNLACSTPTWSKNQSWLNTLPKIIMKQSIEQKKRCFFFAYFLRIYNSLHFCVKLEGIDHYSQIFFPCGCSRKHFSAYYPHNLTFISVLSTQPNIFQRIHLTRFWSCSVLSKQDFFVLHIQRTIY